MNNKSRASSICPLLDTGPPKGDVWVQVKKAVLPYSIVEMGAGAAGKAAVEMAEAAQRAKDSRSRKERREAAQKAFMSGVGDLTDVLKLSDVSTDAHYSAQDARRDAELFPAPAEPTSFQQLWQAFKCACRDVWDGGQPKD